MIEAITESNTITIPTSAEIEIELIKILYNTITIKNKHAQHSREKHIEQCPECHETIYAYDYWRGEILCEKCCRVIKDNAPITYFEDLPQEHYIDNHDEEDLPDYFKAIYNNENSTDDSEGSGVQNSYERLMEAQRRLKSVDASKPKNVKEWRRHRQLDYLYILKSRLGSTDTQIANVEYIIQKHGIKYFHRKASYEEIITSILIWRMKKDQGNRLNGHITKLTCEGCFNKKTYSFIKLKLDSLP